MTDVAIVLGFSTLLVGIAAALLACQDGPGAQSPSNDSDGGSKHEMQVREPVQKEGCGDHSR